MKKTKASPKNQRTVAVIAAAGAGLRMGGDQAKQFMDLDGRPLLSVTLEPFEQSDMVDAIVLVVPLNDIEYCRREVVKRFRFQKIIKVIPGGERRQDSVRLGIETTDGKYDLVVIHDGARPFIDTPFLERIMAAAGNHRAVITGLRVKETVKEVGRRAEVVKTIDRECIWLVQTPQVFRYRDIIKAHRMALDEGWDAATDDSVLVEKLGIPVTMVEGPEKNIKVTTPYDLELARFLTKRSDGAHKGP
jgi:2-C-methyl-D-erythritol 4-phosphate cytidylyltransferase